MINIPSVMSVETDKKQTMTFVSHNIRLPNVAAVQVNATRYHGHDKSKFNYFVCCYSIDLKILQFLKCRFISVLT